MKERIQPIWGAKHLFGLTPQILLGYYVDLRLKDSPRSRWCIDDPDIGERLCEAIEADALPSLRSMRSTTMWRTPDPTGSCSPMGSARSTCSYAIAHVMRVLPHP
jgi:hypothetical protein